MRTLSIGDYGIVGNHTSCALISRLGSIEWCCLPFLDSPSHFAALLDPGAGGKFQLSPQGEFRSEQRYIPKTLVLETLFESPFGRAVLTDWMPLHSALSSEPLIYRRIDVTDGKISWSLVCDPRFDYAETPTEVEFRQAQRREGASRAEIWSRKYLLFRGKEPGQIAQLFSSLDLDYSTFYSGKEIAEAKFNLSAGQSALFAWTWGRRFDAPGAPPVSDRDSSISSLQETAESWRKLAHECAPSGCLFGGPWHDAAASSSLFLRPLVARYSGAIAEAATTSLGPPGSARDERYGRIRNSALTLQALAALGMRDEAKNYFEWLSGVVIRDGVELLQPLYTLDGGKAPPEHEISALKVSQKGYAPATMCAGSSAASRFQLGIYGHLLLASDFYQREWRTLPEGLWQRLREIADFVCGAWRRPDHGYWDDPEKAEHYVVSKALCWTALDRACAIARSLGETPESRWVEELRILHRTICDQGFDTRAHCFVRSFGDTEIDSSALLLPIVGFLPPDDPRIAGTLDAVMERLSEGVLLKRHSLEPQGSLSLASSFLLVMALALSGRTDEASDRMAELCSYRSPLGFFGGQVQIPELETSGNFPSASTHLALINAALHIAAARGKTLPIRRLLGRVEAEPRAASRKIA